MSRSTSNTVESTGHLIWWGLWWGGGGGGGWVRNRRFTIYETGCKPLWPPALNSGFAGPHFTGTGRWGSPGHCTGGSSPDTCGGAQTGAGCVGVCKAPPSLCHRGDHHGGPLCCCTRKEEEEEVCVCLRVGLGLALEEGGGMQEGRFMSGCGSGSGSRALKLGGRGQ